MMMMTNMMLMMLMINILLIMVFLNKVDKFDADGDDAQRIFLLYIDRSAKIVSAFSRNPHPNTITQLQETNP